MLIEILEVLGIALMLTVAIETGVVLLLGFRDKRFLLVLILVNVITNPPLNLLNALYNHFMHHPLPFGLMLVLEAAVILIEAAIILKVFPKYSPRYIVLISAVMNSASFGVGMLFLLVFQ